jgi:hypothetical protein
LTWLKASITPGHWPAFAEFVLAVWKLQRVIRKAKPTHVGSCHYRPGSNIWTFQARYQVSNLERQEQLRRFERRSHLGLHDQLARPQWPPNHVPRSSVVGDSPEKRYFVQAPSFRESSEWKRILHLGQAWKNAGTYLPS